MKLLSYLQTYQGFARRKAVQAIKDGAILVNGKTPENFQVELIA
jgi:16S rRNA U516 pseudouridylate synthase RsuA-like enzyme